MKSKKCLRKILSALLLVAVFVSVMLIGGFNAMAASKTVNVSSWSSLKSNIANQSTSDTVTYKITSPIEADSEITIDSNKKVILTCGVSGHTKDNEDIYREIKGHHGHLFVVESGATLTVRCDINGRSGDANDITKRISSTSANDTYGKALIRNNGGTVVLDSENSILKYNYNKISENGTWTYGSVSYYAYKMSTYDLGVNGAAIYNYDGDVKFSKGYIYGCVADEGPAIYTTGDNVSISGSAVIHGCVAREYGGGIFSGATKLRTLSSPSLSISNCNIYNNLSRNGGGGIWSGYGASLVISGGSYHGNTAVDGSGGAVRCNAGINAKKGNILFYGGGRTKITGGDFYSNNASSGGGIVSSVGDLDKSSVCELTFDGATDNTSIKVRSNTANSNGGGIYVGQNCTSTIKDVSVYSNVAGYGGGIFTAGGGNSLTLNNGCYVYGNTNWGVYLKEGTVSVNGGRYGVSRYAGWDDYDLSRNTKGNIYVASGLTCNFNKSLNGSIRIITNLVSGESVKDNYGIRNDGTVNIYGNSSNYMDCYGKGVSIWNKGTMTVTGKMVITTSQRDFSNGNAIVQKRRGVVNDGTFTMNADSNGNAPKISYCDYKAVENNNNFTMNNGVVEYNKSRNSSDDAYGNGAGVYNSGTFTMTGGEIRNNDAGDNYGGGIYNVGGSTIAMSGGIITNNTASRGGGIYNTTTGIIKMSKTALVDSSNDVYLAGDSFILVNAMFTGDKVVRANVKGGGFVNGRIIAKYGSTATNLATKALYFDYNNIKLDEQYFTVNGKLIRAGNEGTANQIDGINDYDIFLTEQFTVKVFSNGKPKDETVLYSSNDEEIQTNPYVIATKWWNEPVSYNVDSAYYLGNGVKRYNAGWAEDENSKVATLTNNSDVTLTDNKNIIYYAVWATINVKYNGNTNTDVKDLESDSITKEYCELCKKDVISSVTENDVSYYADYITSKNYFVKKYKNIADAQAHKEDADECVPVGWSTNPNSTGVDDPFLLKFNQELTADEWQEYLKRATDNNLIKDDVLNLYVVWDGVPNITAGDVFVKFEEAKAGVVSYDELFNLSNAEATDSKRGDKTNFSKEGTFEIYSYQDLNGETHYLGKEGNNIQAFFQSFKESDFPKGVTVREVPVTFACVDKAGSKKTITIVVRVWYEEPENYIFFTRFISPKYFKDEDGNYIEEANGGLGVNSDWRPGKPETESYVPLLDLVLSNIYHTDTGQWDRMHSTYSFTADEVQEAKGFVDANGIGNLQKNNALTDFSSLYKKS